MTGLMYCADCGAKMYNHRSFKTKCDGTRTAVDNYNCANYTLTLQRETHKCCSHSVTTKAIRGILLDTIRRVSKYAISNEEEFRDKVMEASRLKQESDAKDLKKKLKAAQKRCQELDILIQKLYESYAVGKITEHRFDLLSTQHEKEQAELNAVIDSNRVELADFETDTSRAKQFLALAKKYTDFSELTTPMINEFIEKIIVHAPEKINGERTMEIEIYLKFIGKFEVEPTPEEIAVAEAARNRRAVERQKYLRKKAQQEQKRLEAQLEQTDASTQETA